MTYEVIVEPEAISDLIAIYKYNSNQRFKNEEEIKR
jgi:hypothetical protein